MITNLSSSRLSDAMNTFKTSISKDDLLTLSPLYILFRQEKGKQAHGKHEVSEKRKMSPFSQVEQRQRSPHYMYVYVVMYT